ncbi:M3 family metallopeptidase [Phreatobacter sp. AB_2022a]|uniref:M3 family metallopeptidase n=1 Tax=Phreatobacter sp. AB_2022a TaxID=3003134 RepID=UPI002286F20C|nr:M3 family metallopeptidase [Phreatobacter sp. AB_2022a]MCZ0735926.1 M3 family metallopeptidase [Phreatobacter sp. AB_2022a]
MTQHSQTRQTNPFLRPWTTPFGIAPFGEIAIDHYRPAFEQALAEHRAEIEAIATQAAEPTFANTIDALERAGHALDRLCGVFFNLASSDADADIQAIQREMAPVLAQHGNAISLDERLFGRVKALHAARDGLGLSSEQARVLDKTYKNFVRAGAELDEAGKARMRAVTERLASLGTAFTQNVLKDEATWTLPLAEADLDGLPDDLVSAMRQAARDRGLDGAVMTLGRSMVEPFLSLSPRRDLREKVFKAWVKRGEMGGESDNTAIVAETVALRIERAKLLGYPTFAAFKLDDTMAKTPEAVRALLERVWARAKVRVGEERAALADMARAEGMNAPIEPWDWRFYAEKVRNARHALDEAALKPYFQLDRMIEAAFDVATRLFGVTFERRLDVPVYHPDVRAYQVLRDGKPIGLFLGDYFARTTKRSGAWMSAFRSQEKLSGEVLPIIVNVMNFAKPAAGRPALLSFDDARTLFHEFGHGLHGLLSDVTYPLLSGTSVARDFVEFPSQLYEHWLARPEVLARFAVHAETGEAMPQELIDRLIAARNFNQGFATVEYTSSALVDMAFHSLDSAEGLDPIAFERDELKRLGMPEGMVMRHRTPHFAHIFSGDGYSAGYYSYMWSEVLDADGFAAFEEAGDVFDPALAARLGTFVYSAGNSRDPMEAYMAFRGRAPDPEALLVKRGLAEAA